jgi:sulfate adenylyltransferase subunit 1
MVTGASTANLAILLIDARKGLIEQTYRHSFIASLLKIPHVVVCVNKMDLVNYDELVYDKIVDDFKAFSSKLEIGDIQFAPISALYGDNVVDRSKNMDWYKGSTLLHMLETVHIGSDYNHIDPRFPVQWVIRPQTHDHPDYRGYAGRVAGGVFRVGDKVNVLPSGFQSTIKSIELDGTQLSEAFAPMSVIFTLNDDIDVSRGNMIVRATNQPSGGQSIDVMLCWMNQRPAQKRGRYILRHTTSETAAILTDIHHKIDINTMQHNNDAETLGMNDIARVQIKTANPIFFDSYRKNRQTGSIILIDEGTYETVAAGMII